VRLGDFQGPGYFKMTNHPNRSTQSVTSIKGFNSDLTCRGFQFEVGKTYSVTGKIKACENGFHACPIEHHPLSVLEHYSPTGSRFFEVTQDGKRDAERNKLASALITVGVEISLGELAQRAVKWVFDRANWKDGPVCTGENEGCAASGDGGAATASGDSGAATASGTRGAATASGYGGAATASGDGGAATASGDGGAATASGYSGAATASGTRGAATASGTRGAATASGYGGAATASGDSSAATASGYGGAATASGTRGAATASGYGGAATASGTRGAATASGHGGKARGSDGCALFLVHRDGNWKITKAWAGIVGSDGIVADTWYSLDEAGVPQVQS
jgi:hypothetical protein